MIRRLSTDAEWARGLVDALPRPWAGRLLAQWEARRASFDPLVTAGEGRARTAANRVLRETVAQLAPVSAVLPLDASDADVCALAWDMAERCRVESLELERIAPCIRAAGATLEATQRAALDAIVESAGIAAPEADRYEDTPAVRRMIAAHWWTGRLRKAHGKAREAAAIRLGLVRRDRELYVSEVSKLDRQWQNERNAATLEATIARNVETEQEFTLAQLAAKGTANKTIRRHELMTRINGFERIAIGAGHAGLFLTITCPSKMHRMKTQGARTVENGKWDGTMPDAAQKYLTTTWARIRAALARRKVNLYGFRIAEPQHDGTPHWHCLFFYERQHDAVVRAQVRRYALAVDGDELGAHAKRVDFKTMDPAKGTAAGYIAKYVAKNIDGYALKTDLEGNDSLETSARVEAWASRWRIRQFQQIGGPPVTVWRELRRVESVPADAPTYVHKAYAAVNRVAVLEGRDTASVAWDHYVQAQGGVAVGRAYRVRLARAVSAKPGRYGEAGAAQTIGVEYQDTYRADREQNGIVIRGFTKARTVTVESKRFTWEIMRPAASARAGYAPRPVEGFELGLKRAQRAPWTCVNNCTGSGNVERGQRGDMPGEGRSIADKRGDIEANAGRKAAWGKVSGAGIAAYRESRSNLAH